MRTTLLFGSICTLALAGCRSAPPPTGIEICPPQGAIWCQPDSLRAPATGEVHGRVE